MSIPQVNTLSLKPMPMPSAASPMKVALPLRWPVVVPLVRPVRTSTEPWA